jgi:hypothetical protein
LEARTLLDVPCGDLYWMRHVELPVDCYIGGDVVAEIISANQGTFGDAKHRFSLIDITRDRLPAADILLCRDLLVHLSHRELKNALNNIASSDLRYVLLTTFTNMHEYVDIPTGQWRPINFQQAPFHFPSPQWLLVEGCTVENGIWADKSLALWTIDELSASVGGVRSMRHSPRG